MKEENFNDNYFKVIVTYRNNNNYVTFTRYYKANKSTLKISNNIMEELKRISPEAASSATIKFEIEG